MSIVKTVRELERALIVSPKKYPQDMPCAVCRFRWMQHSGEICPTRPGYFDQVLQIPVPPIMGTTTFIPDENYYKRPDFAVM